MLSMETLNVTYNFSNRIPDVTETQNIVYKMDVTITKNGLYFLAISQFFSVLPFFFHKIVHGIKPKRPPKH